MEKWVYFLQIAGSAVKEEACQLHLYNVAFILIAQVLI